MAGKTDCVFCRIINRELPADVIYENEKTLVVLDRDWAVKGHTLVIWKTHQRNASDLTGDEFAHFSQIYHQTETALLKTLHQNRAVILKTGGLVEHFHFHIYPINTETSWQKIQDIFNKRTKYQATDKEKAKFIEEFKKELAK